MKETVAIQHSQYQEHSTNRKKLNLTELLLMSSSFLHHALPLWAFQVCEKLFLHMTSAM